MSDSSIEKVNILYILSKGHSGSTLLDLLISTHPQISGMGEITNFHEYFTNKKESLCTCGVSLNKCKFWEKVFDKLSRDYTKPLSRDKEFESRNFELFQRVSEVDDTIWICDSSKHLERLQKLLNSERFNVFILHLVRDGRAVAFSNKKKSKRVGNDGLRDRLKKIKKYNYFLNLYYWSSFNEKVRGRYGRRSNYYLIRYEDLINNPDAAIKDIWQKIGLDYEPTYLNMNDIKYHNIGGNRMRFDEDLQIRKDTEYLNKINKVVWDISSFLINTTLLNFGYSNIKKE